MRKKRWVMALPTRGFFICFSCIYKVGATFHYSPKIYTQLLFLVIHEIVENLTVHWIVRAFWRNIWTTMEKWEQQIPAHFSFQFILFSDCWLTPDQKDLFQEEFSTDKNMICMLPPLMYARVGNSWPFVVDLLNTKPSGDHIRVNPTGSIPFSISLIYCDTFLFPTQPDQNCLCWQLQCCLVIKRQ